MGIEVLKTLDSLGFGTQVRRHDDTLSVFVEQELRHLVPQVYDRKYPNLDALQHVPAMTNINPGAMSWAYDTFDMRGVADWLASNARDMPRADVSKDRISFPIRTIITSWGWTVEEIEAARFAQIALDSRKAFAGRRAVAQMEHTTVLNGNAARRIPGFFTNPAVPQIIVPNGDWLGAATADQMVQDASIVVESIWVNTDKTHTANTLGMPNPHFKAFRRARLSNTSKTAYEFFIDTHPEIQQIVPITELMTAGPGGTPAMLAYEKTPENQGAVIPLVFQQMDPQIWGMETVIPARERLGGSVWFYPMSGCFGTGIGS